MSLLPRILSLSSSPSLLFAVPKSRVTKHRRGFKLQDARRKFHLKTGYYFCQNCGATLKLHHQCRKCIHKGYYAWTSDVGDSPLLKEHPLADID